MIILQSAVGGVRNKNRNIFNKTVNILFKKKIFREIKTTVKGDNTLNRENLHA
jgi:hypothetical protein